MATEARKATGEEWGAPRTTVAGYAGWSFSRGGQRCFGIHTMHVDDRDPEANCVTCGKRITAETYDDLWARYTDHVTFEHDKPATKSEAAE